MKLDLHLHTSASDGALAPADLAAAAARAGLGAIAVTDHDTCAGIADAQRAAGTAGVRVIAGIELSCSMDGAEMHLLGYAVDPGHAGLRDLAAGVGVRRRARIGEIVSRLQALGVRIEEGDVTVPEGNASVGRPHVAQALVRLGAVGSFQEAFSRWLGDAGPAYVPSRGPDVATGIATIRDAGGCAVWAHPSLQDTRWFAKLAEKGLEGVEVLRPSLEPAASITLEQAARSARLLATGGSDWHGGARPALGSWYVTEKHVGRFLDRIGFTVD